VLIFIVSVILLFNNSSIVYHLFIISLVVLFIVSFTVYSSISFVSCLIMYSFHGL
jgi:hypothetical protein